MNKFDYLIVGCGLAGSVLAERIANVLNKRVLIVEKRNHIGGNAYDEYDKNGILVHRYGPHIFHTNSSEVFEYLSKFTTWIPYQHKVLAKYNNQLYPIPINRITINKVYNINLKTDEEVHTFLEKIREKRNPILNSEDIIINKVGYKLFDMFFRNYTKKQWGLEPKYLSPSVCGRIPVRYNDDCRYFSDKFQYMPKDGYTEIFKRMLNHKNIEVVLNQDYKSILDSVKFNRMIYTGPIDYFFDYIHGKLPYRSIKFEWIHLDLEYYQKTAQINYTDESVKYTRVIEHKYLSNQNASTTTISREYPCITGEPFYPIPSIENFKLYEKYLNETKKLRSVIFVGRLAEYKYYNMDQVIIRALKLVKKL